MHPLITCRTRSMPLAVSKGTDSALHVHATEIGGERERQTDQHTLKHIDTDTALHPPAMRARAHTHTHTQRHSISRSCSKKKHTHTQASHAHDTQAERGRRRESDTHIDSHRHGHKRTHIHTLTHTQRHTCQRGHSTRQQRPS